MNSICYSNMVYVAQPWAMGIRRLPHKCMGDCKVRAALSHRPCHFTQAKASSSSDMSSHNHDDMNYLHMLLKKAVDAEDFDAAVFIRDRIQHISCDGTDTGTLGWENMGILNWLVDRASDLGYGIPTPVQSRAGPVILHGADCILVAPTGSGKTLAFLLPLLSLLSYPPDKYPDDLLGPQLIIVVPTRELGAQIAMIIYKLFGGSVSQGIPGHAENMFRYSGPRGIKVKGLIFENEVDEAVENRYLEGSHVVVGTPCLISEALNRGVEVVQHCRALCFDEADACYNLFPNETENILNRAISGDTTSATTGNVTRRENEKPVTVLSGATLSDQLIEHAIERKWLVGQNTVEVRLGDHLKISPRIKHRYVAVNRDEDILGALCRLILADQKSHSRDAMPTRGIIYVKDADIARKISEPLRNIFWGKHSISVLLPDGSEPIKSLHAFRDNKTSMLIATASSSRGLDLPAVTHVYSTFVPSEEEAEEYIHMAGRLGRIGTDDPGLMTTILVSGEQVEHFVKMLVTRLSIPASAIQEVSPPMPRSVADLMGDTDEELDEEVMDDAKRALETILAISNEKYDDTVK